jgi:predicted Zn-dependent peptidase
MGKSQNTIIHTFANKVRMVYSHSNDKITALSVFIKVGSVNEGEAQHGMSHLLEHMLFKGSKSFPRANNIAWQMDAIGAYFNAYTTKDKTCYLATCPTSHVRRMMEIMSDVIVNPSLRREDFELERNVVIEELRNAEDDPDSKIEDRMEELTFEGHQLAKSVGGSVADVRAITYDDMLRYYRDYYCAENIVVSICTDLSASEAIRIVGASGFRSARQGCDRPLIVRNLNPQTDMRYDYIRKPLEQLYIAIGFRVGSMNGLERFAFDILESYLAGPLSSRLFVKLREENGISYGVSCSYSGYIDMSSLVIRTSLDKSKLYKNPNGNKKGALTLIFEELNRLVTEGISQEGLDHTRDYLIGRNLVEIESSLGSSDFDGQVVTLGLTPNVFIRDLSREYEKIDRDLVNRLVKTYIKRENMSVVVLSDMDQKEGRRIHREIERLMRF